MSKPIAVLISDIHYNINTLEVADKAMNMAIDKANELEIPLVVAGDLHDTKANLRGECVNRMLETFSKYQGKLKPLILIGNHDRINEKSKAHSLNFLESVATTLSDAHMGYLDVCIIPYQHNPDDFREILKQIPLETVIIAHQGLNKTNAGHYFQDNSALDLEDVAGRRIISGHYHTRQTIDLPNGGKWDYLGNPYTLGFGESNDPEKGFQILMEDGTLEFVPTNLRKHIALSGNFSEGRLVIQKSHKGILPTAHDLVRVKIEGTREELSRVTKSLVVQMLAIADFKLDLIAHEEKSIKIEKNTSPSVQLDAIIDSLEHASEEQKLRLKTLWKSL